MYNISIIIPTYNPGDYLIECLKSIYNQTLSYDEFETIIILNGDIKNFRNFIENIYQSKPQGFSMKFYESSIPGVSRARNIGIDHSKGKYLFFLDDDDILSPNYFETMMISANTSSIIASNLYSFYNDINEKIPNYLSYKEISDSIFNRRKYLSNSCCKLIPRELISSKRFNVKFHNGEDALFMFSISDKIKHIIIEKDSIYYRRLRPNSASRKKISFIKKFKRIFNQQIAYTSIYLSKPFKYNLFLYLSRLVAVFKQ